MWPRPVPEGVLPEKVAIPESSLAFEARELGRVFFPGRLSSKPLGGRGAIVSVAEHHMVLGEDVVDIYQRLMTNSIMVWLTGGWGIDALLGKQSRPHKDLDLIALVEDVAAMRNLLAHHGYVLKELWPENRWAIDATGAETPTAFVLNDSNAREIDVHAMRLDDGGNGVPAWEAEGLILERQDLAGNGVVAGFAVQCLSLEMQVRRHKGYELPDWQLRDLELLHQMFGIEYRDEGSTPLTSA